MSPEALAALGSVEIAPWAVAPLAVTAILYGLGSRTLRTGNPRSRSERRRQAALFWCGWVLLAFTLMGPLHPLGERLFSAHMIEHEMLMVVAAPLLVAARPMPALLLGLPDHWRGRVVAWARRPGPRRVWSGLTELWTATIVHVAVLWLWHLPALFEAALDSEALHILQHVSFFGSALTLWEAVWRRHVRRAGQGEAALALFLISLQSGLLGALLTFSQRLWFPADESLAPAFGLDPLQDQQLAGLVMWIPACSVYVAIGLFVAGKWLAGMERRPA